MPLVKKQIIGVYISLSSCLGKFFNNLRLSKSFEELDLFYPHLMGFRPGMRTSNNIFALKTLIDKQFKKGKNFIAVL